MIYEENSLFTAKCVGSFDKFNVSYHFLDLKYDNSHGNGLKIEKRQLIHNTSMHYKVYKKYFHSCIL